jgi:hypothetical protein
MPVVVASSVLRIATWTSLPRAAVATGRDAAPGGPVHAAPIQPPELPANPSHIHLVLDDGPERVVATVAMRGNDVHVALRSSDDASAAAFARNAASLDHAMRARGLALGELTSDATERAAPQRDGNPDHPGRSRNPDHPDNPRDSRDHWPRERRHPDAEPFALEDEP